MIEAIEVIKELLKDPAVASVVTFVGTLLSAWIRRWFELRGLRREEEEKLARAQLQLKALEVVGRIELLSEQRKQLGYAPTPTEVKRATAKTELAATGAHEAVVAKVIEEVLPFAREQAKQVRARSVLPLTHGSSGEHVIVIPDSARVPEIAPPPPRDVAALDLSAVQDANETTDGDV